LAHHVNVVLANHLDWLSLSNLWLNDHDVTPNLLSEFDVTNLKSEVSSVLAFTQGSNKIDSEVNLSVWLNLLKHGNDLLTEFVTT